MDKLIEKMDKIFEKAGFEWQYLLWSPTFPYRFKVGRSRKFDARIASIRATMSAAHGKRVRVSLFLKVPVFFAGMQEKALHKCAMWRPASNMPGSGWTEWTWSLNVYCMLLCWIGSFVFGYHRGISLILLALPLPLDFALFSIILASVQYGIAAAAVYGAFKLFI